MDINKVYTIKMQNWQEPFKCIVIDDGLDWLLVRNLFDFSIDGYALLSKKFIKEYIHSDKEEFTEKILIANCKLKHSDRLTIIPLKNNELFKYLKENEIISQLSFKDETYVYIGKIEKLLQHSFYFKTINTNGVWDKAAELLKYNSVRKIDFDTDYLVSLITYSKSIK